MGDQGWTVHVRDLFFFALGALLMIVAMLA